MREEDRQVNLPVSCFPMLSTPFSLRPWRVVWLLLGCAAALSCERLNVAVTVSPAPVMGALTEETPTAPALPSWLEVYFTDPTAPEAAYYEGGPDEALVAAIDRARLAVEVAAYDLNLWSIRDALLRAWRRGVRVRLVVERDNMNSKEIEQLLAAGIPIESDWGEGLMHHKFILIDRSEVWVGSGNFTVGGFYRDHNNLLCLRSQKVVADYLNEFEEMFLAHRFGADSLADTPYPAFFVNGIPVEVYFAPEDGVAERLVNLIRNAHDTIYFLAYSFTSDALGEAIRAQAAAGVTVAGVLDAEQATTNEGTEYDAFLQEGLDVRLDGAEGLMHHKVMILDSCIVVTGSYNFSRRAEEKNDENLLVLRNCALGEQFTREFWRIYGQAEPQR